MEQTTKWKWKYSLSDELTFFAFGAVLTGTFIFTIIFIPAFSSIVEKETQEQMLNHSKLYSMGLAYPLYTVDQNQIEQFVQATESDSALDLVEVYDEQGKVVARRVAENANEENLDPTLTNETKIEYQGLPVGRIRFSLNRNAHSRQVQVYGFSIMILLIMGFVVSGLFLYFYVRRRILHPMRVLKRSSIEVSAGNYVQLDLKPNLPVDWERVKSAFDFMSLTLKSHNEKLEEIVETRTQERDAERLKSVESARLAAVGEMSAGIAHEINNPMAVIVGQTQILRKVLENEGHLDEKKAQGLEKIVKMANRITKIIKNLKNFSRQGDKDPFENCSLNKIIEDTLDFCGVRMKNHNIDFSLESDSKEIFFLGREVQIGQVILNLINNSIDAIVDSNDKRWIKIELKLSGPNVTIRIIDSGRGIAEEIRKKIMQPFFTTKEVGKGTGLGLSLSKGIVEQHHGKFYYDEKCANTCFVIELPQQAMDFAI